jgi:FlaA1/EpsC-like NDP-sugar epimerase
MIIDPYLYLNRKNSFFSNDLDVYYNEMSDIVKKSRFLILGAGGTIGQALAKELFKMNPKILHAVDISENNLAELVRDLRSSKGYIDGEFKTFALDICSDEYDKFFMDYGKYDYVMNLAALKHVRSEKDPYTIMRMININILSNEKVINQCKIKNVKKYFCVSSDKAANPANIMGATKKIMEMFLIKESVDIDISSARFANVLFSDGSLTYSFLNRIQKHQPIVAPKDIDRYFISKEESGQLCLISTLLGKNNQIFFPKLSKNNIINFEDLAIKFLEINGFKPRLCKSEKDAREISIKGVKNEWPCFFSKSDTSGEKKIEEFFLKDEKVILDKFKSIGMINGKKNYPREQIENFKTKIKNFKLTNQWNKKDLLKVFNDTLENFQHIETGKNLDEKM